MVDRSSPAGAIIRARREAAGLRQADLAEKLGVAPRTVIHWEQGDWTPREEMRERIADVLGGDADDYVSEMVEHEPSDDVKRLRSTLARTERERDSARRALSEALRRLDEMRGR